MAGGGLSPVAFRCCVFCGGQWMCVSQGCCARSWARSGCWCWMHPSRPGSDVQRQEALSVAGRGGTRCLLLSYPCISAGFKCVSTHMAPTWGGSVNAGGGLATTPKSYNCLSQVRAWWPLPAVGLLHGDGGSSSRAGCSPSPAPGHGCWQGAQHHSSSA